MLTPDERLALETAMMLRAKRKNPIPSATSGIKKPLYEFKRDYGWETMFPDHWFTEESWRTTNIQVLCGRFWRLLVIDLDGNEARYTWKQWGVTPRTWITHREDGDSWHLWFRLPKDYPEPLSKAFLWKGDGDHQGIERLCDRSMIVSPPSFHVEHRQSRYRYLNKANSPLGMGLPADIPNWVLNLKPIEREIHPPEFVPPPPRLTTRTSNEEVFMGRDELLSKIHDKIGLARQWGVRFTGSVSHDGWAECRSIERPDDRPSAAMHIDAGIYTDRGADHKPLSFFDLMIAMGQAHDFIDAKARLAQSL